MPDEEIVRLLTHYIVTEVASRPPESTPAPDFAIIDSGLVDSLGLFKLISFVEEKFEIKIAPEEILFENFATINAIVSMVRAKQSAQSAGPAPNAGTAT